MDTLKNLLELIKTTTYELLALVLPGAVVLFATEFAFGVATPGDTIGLIIASYLLGLGFQGIGAFVGRGLKVPPPDPRTQALAVKLLEKKLGETVPPSATLDICLTHIGDQRTVYDKFVALRDSARGLIVATPVVTYLLLYGHWTALNAPGGSPGAVRVLAVIGACIVLTGAYVQRYRRFQPLAAQVVFGQFIATQLAEKKEGG